jgi:Cof subfamily protein (haloacid dehalogenase superfamily)
MHKGSSSSNASRTQPARHPAAPPHHRAAHHPTPAKPPATPPVTPHGKPIRLVAIDLDGTLLSSRKSITKGNQLALRAARDAGVKIIIATARPPRSVRVYYEALKLDAPTINYNGALIWDEQRRKAIEHIPLDVTVAKKIIAFGRKKFPDLLVSVEILDKWYTDHYEDVPEFMTETSKHFSPDFIGPLDAFMRVPITKLMLLGAPVKIEELEHAIADKFGAVAAQTRSDAHMLQLMSPATSKAGALAKVAKSFGIPPSEVMAIGDAPNDVHMLQWAGLAVVPENGWESAKKVADAVVPSNDNDGVAVALKRFVLGG